MTSRELKQTSLNVYELLKIGITAGLRDDPAGNGDQHLDERLAGTILQMSTCAGMLAHCVGMDKDWDDFKKGLR